MKKSKSKVQKINFSVNEFRQSVKIFLCILFFISSTTSYAEENSTIKIPLDKITNSNTFNNELPKRNLNILFILPDVIHDTTNDVLKIVSQHVTFESVTYYITNKDGFIFSSGELTLLKGDEKRVFISSLPAGTYNIILEIENEYFQGEFDVDTF